MFERLTETFSGLFKSLSGNATLSEKNIADAMANVRSALLDADVHLDVVNTFCEQVTRDALGKDVTKSLKPGEEMIGIVHQRLVELLGGAEERVEVGPDGKPNIVKAPERIMRITPGPTIVMMCGLQGSGKTTTCGKLAGFLKKRGRSVMLVAADLQRPAAVDQLETVANQVQSEMGGGASVRFYSEPDKVAAYGKAVGVAVDVCRRAIDEARRTGVDTVILDTAGRLHVNDALMGELFSIKKLVQPHHIFLVVDAMTGQDAVVSAKAFHQKLDVDGVILSKYDSDTRGGAALSVRHVTGAPIRFVGVGEKLDALEEFHATRVAGRILGMGDVVSLVEKAQEQVTEDEAKSIEEKLAKGEMTMDDYLKQLKTLRRMGPMKQLLGLIPGVGAALKDLHIDEKHLDRVEAMINSMTRRERAEAAILNHGRRRRIAQGSGTQPDEVNALVRQFEMLGKMSKQMASMTAADKVRAVKQMSGEGGMGSLVPGLKGMPMLRDRGTSYTPSVKDRFKKRKR